MKKNNLFLLLFLFLLLSFNILASSQLEQGIEEYNKSNYTLAIDYLTDVLLEEGNNFTAQYYLGLSYIKLGEYELAQNALEIARDLSPQHYKVHLNLGRAYYNLRDYQKALEALERAEEIENGRCADL